MQATLTCCQQNLAQVVAGNRSTCQCPTSSAKSLAYQKAQLLQSCYACICADCTGGRSCRRVRSITLVREAPACKFAKAAGFSLRFPMHRHAYPQQVGRRPVRFLVRRCQPLEHATWWTRPNHTHARIHGANWLQAPKPLNHGNHIANCLMLGMRVGSQIYKCREYICQLWSQLLRLGVECISSVVQQDELQHITSGKWYDSTNQCMSRAGLQCYMTQTPGSIHVHLNP